MPKWLVILLAIVLVIVALAAAKYIGWHVHN